VTERVHLHDDVDLEVALVPQLDVAKEHSPLGL
jgi:hypothetical protein